VEKLPEVPIAEVFQKESTPQVPLGVAPAPVAVPLLSQYKEAALRGVHAMAQRLVTRRVRAKLETWLIIFWRSGDLLQSARRMVWDSASVCNYLLFTPTDTFQCFW